MFKKITHEDKTHLDPRRTSSRSLSNSSDSLRWTASRKPVRGSLDLNGSKNSLRADWRLSRIRKVSNGLAVTVGGWVERTTLGRAEQSLVLVVEASFV